MNAVSVAITGALTLLLLAGAGLSAANARESLRRLRAALGSPAPLSDVDGERSGLFGAAVVGAGPGQQAGQLVAVTDTAGYWWVRHWAAGASTNALTLVGGLVVRLLYGENTTRGQGNRRRGSRLVPDELAVRTGGERTDLALGRDGRPLQRLEADGGTVPFLVPVLPVVLGVAVLAAELLAPAYLPGIDRWLAVTPLWEAAAVAYLAALVGVKVYHDTALVGDWDAVVPADGTEAPVAAADAAGTADPPGTAQACLRGLASDERLLVLGRLRSGDDGVELVDGVVTTRGRGFLAVAAAVGATRGAAATLALLAGAAVTGYLTYGAL
jgi:hypothetical protein